MTKVLGRVVSLVIGFSSNVFAKLWAIRQWLSLARNMGIPKLKVELDSFEAIRLVKGTLMESHPLYTLITDIRWFLHRN